MDQATRCVPVAHRSPEPLLGWLRQRTPLSRGCGIRPCLVFHSVNWPAALAARDLFCNPVLFLAGEECSREGASGYNYSSPPEWRHECADILERLCCVQLCFPRC